eukprot:gene29150-32371_t
MQFCNAWSWCSDPSGCTEGDQQTYRQCWIKSIVFAPGADLEAEFTASGTVAPGWISGFRAAAATLQHWLNTCSIGSAGAVSVDPFLGPSPTGQRQRNTS